MRPRRRTAKQWTVRPSLQWALDSITTGPAIVGNNRSDLLAANHLGRALYADLYADPTRPPNFARFTFLDSAAHRFYPDWDLAADMTVANLRTAAGQRPTRQGPARPGRRAVHPQRRVPPPLGLPQRPHPRRRRQALPPPRRRRPRPRLRKLGSASRTRPQHDHLRRRTRIPHRPRPRPARLLGSHQRKPARRQQLGLRLDDRTLVAWCGQVDLCLIRPIQASRAC